MSNELRKNQMLRDKDFTYLAQWIYFFHPIPRRYFSNLLEQEKKTNFHILWLSMMPFGR